MRAWRGRWCASSYQGRWPAPAWKNWSAGKLDYTLLDDQAANDTRLRLNASVVKVAHDGDPASAQSVTVSYVEGGKLKTVSAKQVVLACWHRVIPYLTDEISAAQVTALNDQIKVPLIYTNVLLNNWRAFKEAGFRASMRRACSLMACRWISLCRSGTTSSPIRPMIRSSFTSAKLWSRAKPGFRRASRRRPAGRS
ncbi:MAG: hypothetical protein NVV83_21460 [Afipia sp.]|nr:hypothetical protein [Afipia sp.]